MPASPIRRLVPYADRAKARGVKVYHLNIGQPDIETPAEMMNGYRNVDIKVLSYGPSQGLKEYVDTLVQYYGGVGIAVRAQDILITTGGSDASIATGGGSLAVNDGWSLIARTVRKTVAVEVRSVLSVIV